MNTRTKMKNLLFLGIIASVFFLLQACEPPPHFLTTSNVDAPLIAGFGEQDPVQRNIAPGTLNIGSKRPSEDMLIYTNTGKVAHLETHGGYLSHIVGLGYG